MLTLRLAYVKYFYIYDLFNPHNVPIDIICIFWQRNWDFFKRLNGLTKKIKLATWWSQDLAPIHMTPRSHSSWTDSFEKDRYTWHTKWLNPKHVLYKQIWDSFVQMNSLKYKTKTPQILRQSLDKLDLKRRDKEKNNEMKETIEGNRT